MGLKCFASRAYDLYLSSAFAFFFAQIVSNITVLNFLQALGYVYTKEEVLESELDILKSLNFQINLPTPLAYVEMLLEVLGTLLNVSDVGWRLPKQAKNQMCPVIWQQETQPANEEQREGSLCSG